MASLVSLKNLEQRIGAACSSSRKENAHAHRPTNPALDVDRPRTGGVATLDPTADDGAGARAAGTRHSRVRSGRDEHARRAEAAADEANGGEMAQSVPRQAAGRAAR